MRAGIVRGYLAAKDHAKGIWRYQGTDEKHHHFFEEKSGYVNWTKVPRSRLSLPEVAPYREEWGTYSYYYSIDILNGFVPLASERESHRRNARTAGPVVIPSPVERRDVAHLSNTVVARFPAVPLQVDIDVSAVEAKSPEIKTWALHAAEVCRVWYPVIVRTLGAGARLPEKVTLTFVPHALAPAYYDAGERIYFDTSHVLEDPTNYGMAVHELCHVVQQYKASGHSWVTEGLADYVRFYLYETDPANGALHAQSRYTDSYRTTALFFAFLENTSDPGIVLRLSTAMRDPATNDAVIRRVFAENLALPPGGRKTLDELWRDFMAAAGASPSASEP